MNQRMRIGLIAGGIIAVIGLIFLCMAVIPRNSGTPAPQTTVEQEDCDAEDRRNREVEDCGIGVLIDPGKTTKPVVTPARPPAPRCTSTQTRRC